MTAHDISLWRAAITTGAILGILIGIPIGMWITNHTRRAHPADALAAHRAEVCRRLYDQDDRGTAA